MWKEEEIGWEAGGGGGGVREKSRDSELGLTCEANSFLKNVIKNKNK